MSQISGAQLLVQSLLGVSPSYTRARYANAKSLHEFSATSLKGKLIDFNEFAGKVVLIVNTASHCSFRAQFPGLQALHDKYKDKGFEILAFPSADFNNQEFSSSEKTQEFCDLNFNIKFPLFQKVHVKGANAHPVWQFLTTKSLNGLTSLEPKWNFQKYLLDKEGHLADVFLPIASPRSPRISRRIEFLLNQP